MLARKSHARYAESQALRLRGNVGVANNMPVNPYEVAIQKGVDVRFIDMPSIEGVYLPQGAGEILVSGLRPAGRQTFTCAHELGHHQLSHGEKVDELIEAKRTERIYDRDEFQADTFASFFLMPRTAVLHAFHARGWDVKTASAEQFYQISRWFGVGYTTLIGHISRQLKLLDWVRADELMGKNLKIIRASICGRKCGAALFVIDPHWTNRTIDCEVGDLLMFPIGMKFGGVRISTVETRSATLIAQAVEKGVTPASAADGAWSVQVRATKKGYVGRYIYKYLEEEPLDE
jgi:hypothetical protein